MVAGFAGATVYCVVLAVMYGEPWDVFYAVILVFPTWVCVLGAKEYVGVLGEALRRWKARPRNDGR